MIFCTLKKGIWTSVICLFLWVGCANESTTNTASPIVENTPNAVALFWLENYFQNEFTAAKQYSTSETKAMIDTIEQVLFLEVEEVALDFKITAVQCQVLGNNANCTYIYEEGDEKIPESIALQKINNKWLVNAQLIQDDE